MLNLELHYNFKTRYANEFNKHNLLIREIASDIRERLTYLLSNKIIKKILLYGDYDSCHIIAGYFESQAQDTEVVYADVIQHQNAIGMPQHELSKRFKDIDCVISLFSLNFSQNIDSVFREYHTILKKDAIFLGILCGTDSLWQLKEAMIKTDEAHFNGVRNAFIPLPNAAQILSSVQKAGFHSIVLEQELHQIQYNKVWELLDDLRKTGNGNCLQLRSKINLTKKYLQDLELSYETSMQKYKIADFNVITVTGLCGMDRKNG